MIRHAECPVQSAALGVEAMYRPVAGHNVDTSFKQGWRRDDRTPQVAFPAEFAAVPVEAITKTIASAAIDALRIHGRSCQQRIRHVMIPDGFARLDARAQKASRREFGRIDALYQ